MQWVWEEFRFRGRPFRVAHFEAPCEEREVIDDDMTVRLDRCEEELGACLWHDTNLATLRFLEERRPDGYSGVRALELGAGAGACGIALALGGADATITDFDALVPLLDLNARENGFGGCQGQAAEAHRGAGAGAQAARPRRGRRKAGKRRGGKDQDSDEDDSADGRDPEGCEEDEQILRRPSAKERKAARAAKKLAAEEGRAAAKADRAAPTEVPGSCLAQAADWREEARQPALPAGAFDLVVVCDCLYENRESWEDLQAILQRVPAPGGEVVLASATLRRPFLEVFLDALLTAGFNLVEDTVTDHARVVALTVPSDGGSPAVPQEPGAGEGVDADGANGAA
mmetsp:Transcript_79510/g.221237  ORF Transcript_79510/g.221237 Transcript_79510/m.221237 type:complete len:343 (-) Transcript_79510:133-1161(-)